MIREKRDQGMFDEILDYIPQSYIPAFRGYIARILHLLRYLIKERCAYAFS